MNHHDIVPKKDYDFDEFQKKVVDTSTANKVAWHIPDEELDELTAPRARWVTTWSAAKHKHQRNLAQVRAKIDARLKYEKVLRPFIQQWIQKNRKVSDAHRVAMGIRPLDKVKTDAPVPVLTPHISHRPLVAHRVKLLVAHLPQNAVNLVPGRPEHCSRTEFVYAFNEGKILTHDLCPHETSSQKKSKIITFDPAMAGREVILYSRFINTRNQPGPWSEQIRFRIP